MLIELKINNFNLFFALFLLLSVNSWKHTPFTHPPLSRGFVWDGRIANSRTRQQLANEPSFLQSLASDWNYFLKKLDENRTRQGLKKPVDPTQTEEFSNSNSTTSVQTQQILLTNTNKNGSKLLSEEKREIDIPSTSTITHLSISSSIEKESRSTLRVQKRKIENRNKILPKQQDAEKVRKRMRKRDQ